MLLIRRRRLVGEAEGLEPTSVPGIGRLRGTKGAGRVLGSLAELGLRYPTVIQLVADTDLSPDAIDAFGAAVRRGVDVRVLMPSTAGSDNPMVQHAGHRNFEKLLRCGVRLFEYPHTLLHQKIMTVDGVWSAIGSSNFDDRSFETNDEITAGFRDPRLARRLEEIFERDLERCMEVDAARWRRRGLAPRLKSAAAYLVNEVL